MFMKNILKKYYLLALCCFTFASCEDFEEVPLEWATESYVWDETDLNGTYASYWVNKIYSQLPTAYFRFYGGNKSGVLLECATDDAVPSDAGNGMWNIIRGGYSASTLFDDNWSTNYGAIRKCNIFFANYMRVPWADQQEAAYLAAEVRFLRAYFIFDMVQRYGGVPLIGDKVYKPTDAELLTLSRNSFKECIDYVLSELEAVKDHLRPEASLADRGSGNGKKDGKDPYLGRIRKHIVLAFKAKILLYAASPLFNGTGESDKPYIGYPEYDRNRWGEAAKAAKVIIDSKEFELEPDRYMLNYTSINKEVIWMRTVYSQTSNGPLYLTPVGFRVSNKDSEGRISPTQELVDAFPMKNGKPIYAEGSGYDAQNPYVNRDPRLNETVFCNGSRWLRQTIETFEGGKNKPNNSTKYKVQTLTGYYGKKLVADDSENSIFTNTNCNGGYPSGWAMIRYADILLMYAEAQNEFLDKPDQSVYDAIETVRKRAGLDPYQLPENLTQEEMREYIRTERRIELAFEESRFWDIRRWKIADKVYGTMLHGMRIEKNEDGTFRYTPTEIIKPYFSKEMYLQPIALKETQVNDNMQQNPGY